jgi:Phospholipase_D-nuclease N-terminal/Short C-terminal domain
VLNPRRSDVVLARGEETAMNLWDVLLSIFWFVILFAWIWLLISILGDIFRDHELSGWGKALWTLFLIVIPWLGSLVYLIARGRAMNERALERAQGRQQDYAAYARRDAPSTADEIAKFADLRDRGAMSEEEFQHAKAKALGREPAVPSGDRRTVSSQTT